MCEGSIHVQHRQAKARESLQVQILRGYPDKRGLYPQNTKGGDNRLVCIRKPTEAVISHLKMEHGPIADPSAYLYDGKRNVRVKIYHCPYDDGIILPNGALVPMYMIKVGTKFEIGQPAKPKDPAAKGMAAVKAALVEQEKTEPTPVSIVKRVLAKAGKRLIGSTRRPMATGRVKSRVR